ncbi:MAG: hypothetical protein ACTHLW_12245 [Verrucomicrobiota bacterium]
MNVMKQKLAMFTVAAVITAAAIEAQAQPYYLAGDFNGWDNSGNPLY